MSVNVNRVFRFQRRLPILTGTSLRLEIGCGETRHANYIGLDIQDFGQEIVWDVEEGIPLPDDSCEEVLASHTLEHLSDEIGVMNEIHRVLKKNGVLYIIVPHRDHARAYVPSHINFYDEFHFSFYEREEYVRMYSSRLWKVIDCIVNDRKDMHVHLTPIK